MFIAWSLMLFQCGFAAFQYVFRIFSLLLWHRLCCTYKLTEEPPPVAPKKCRVVLNDEGKGIFGRMRRMR
jgi:hypothetical protein